MTNVDILNKLTDIYTEGDSSMNRLDSFYPKPTILIPINGFHPRFKGLESGFIHLCQNPNYDPLNKDTFSSWNQFFVPSSTGGSQFKDVDEAVKWLKYLVTG